jgi:hypothetical protein
MAYINIFIHPFNNPKRMQLRQPHLRISYGFTGVSSVTYQINISKQLTNYITNCKIRKGNKYDVIYKTTVDTIESKEELDSIKTKLHNHLLAHKKIAEACKLIDEANQLLTPNSNTNDSTSRT